MRRLGAFQRLDAGRRQTRLLRNDLEFDDTAVVELGDLGRARRGQFVDPGAVHYPGALGAEPAEHLGHRPDPLGREDADQ